MAKREKKVKKGSPKWMATFSDLVTLVLVFFVLLFSMSQIDAVKFLKMKEVFDGVGIGEKGYLTDDEVLNINITKKTMEDTVITEMMTQREKEAQKLDDLYEKIKKYIEEKNLESKLDVTREIDGVSVVITDSVFFDTASAVIKPEAKDIIDALTDFFKQVTNEIEIEGHTDNRPINRLEYPSNWELSSARASSIIRYLIANYNYDPTRFVSKGYGETRPIAPNDSEENMEKNRRVIIFIKDNIVNFNDTEAKEAELNEIAQSALSNN